MSKIVDNLRARIIRRETRIVELGTELLPLILEQARDLQKLRQKSKDWAADLKEIKMEARSASRYLMIAENWETPPDRDVMKRLPSDPQKLEWLSRLKPADLKQLSHDKDLIRSDRTTVINEVKKLTKVPIQRKPVTLVAVKKAWKSFRKTALPNLLELTPEDRTEFFTDMEASLSQFRNDAFEDEDGEGMEVNENQEAESSAQGEASEEPAEDEQAEEGEGEGTHPDQRASESAAKQPEAPPEFQPPAKTEEPAKPLAAKQKEGGKPATKADRPIGSRR